MRPKPEPIFSLDPDLFANSKPRRRPHACRPSLLAGLVAVGSLCLFTLIGGSASRAGAAQARPGRPVPPRRVVPRSPRPLPGRVDRFVIPAREGIDDAMVIAAPRRIDEAMIIGRARDGSPIAPEVAPVNPSPAPRP